jgi:hypothetical protein
MTHQWDCVVVGVRIGIGAGRESAKAHRAHTPAPQQKAKPPLKTNQVPALLHKATSPSYTYTCQHNHLLFIKFLLSLFFHQITTTPRFLNNTVLIFSSSSS